MPNPLSYNRRRDKASRSFDEVAAQVRNPGRELMAVVTAVYPDITIIVIQNLGWDGSPNDCLMPALTDGMLEGMGPRTTLIDGMENAYPLMLRDTFSRLRQIAEKDGLAKSQVPELYKKRVQYGFGFCVDYDARHNGTYNGWQTDPEEFENNYRSPKRLERRRRMRSQTGPCAHVALSDGDRDGIDGRQDWQNRPSAHDPCLLRELSDHANGFGQTSG